MKNISSFFEFPGILIIIGVAFILCAIIISLVTKRKTDDVNETQTDDEIAKDQEDNYYFEPVKLIDDEDTKPANNETSIVNQEEDDLFKELELTKEQQNTNDDEVENL